MKKLSACIAAASSLFLFAAPSEIGPAGSGPDVDIISIQDAAMTMPGTLFHSIRPDADLRPAESYAASLNVFLIRDRRNGKLALIDTGFGRKDCALLKELSRRQIKPEDISAVFITHIHPDHVGGLTTPDGRPVFPNAKIYIARKEYEAWSKDQSRARLAIHLAPNRKNIVLLDYDKEVKPWGLTPLFYPGHTPGHTVFRMKLARPDGARTIYFVGDIVHAAELQIPNPDFCARFDMAPETAVKSRCELLDKAVFWYGAHLPFPGIIRIVRQDGGRFGFQM
ncbi:MAG: MBL fold metallo-hydrolase [Lentisphaeria bacterium]|nr:MBL fold metallo-hydrolase [Lentisphaeria bacterium]